MTRVSLDERQVAAVGGGWLQERYYSSEGDSVRDFLSFRSVYEINPFEVGASHSRGSRPSGSSTAPNASRQCSRF